jgi:hypothetical protein
MMESKLGFFNEATSKVFLCISLSVQEHTNENWQFSEEGEVPSLIAR